MRLTALIPVALLAGAGMLAQPLPAAAEPAMPHVGAGKLRAEPAHGDAGLRNRDRKLPQHRGRIRSKLHSRVEREVVIIERAPVERPVPEPAPESTAPPDPSAPFAGLRPRGAGSPPVPEVGATLPEGVAYVALDWRTYGLERPPAGQIYARIRRNILRIDPTNRRVLERIEPEAAQR